MSGMLYVAATPIGNLGDVSDRLREVLGRCTRVAAEDTRHTGRLLAHLGIDKPLLSLHEHNEDRALETVLRHVKDGEEVVLVSDAGTPLISDPGFRLVAAARIQGIAVTPLPGPCALITALSVSGLPAHSFTFHGFAPAKSKARLDFLRGLARSSRTQIFYESSHRIAAMIADCIEVMGADRRAFVGREMTKLHEAYELSDLGTLSTALQSGEIVERGEFVLIIEGAADQEADDDFVGELLQVLLDELAPSRAARVAARVTGRSRKHCFEIAEALKSKS